MDFHTFHTWSVIPVTRVTQRTLFCGAKNEKMAPQAKKFKIQDATQFPRCISWKEIYCLRQIYFLREIYFLGQIYFPRGNLFPEANLLPEANLFPEGNLFPGANLFPEANLVPEGNLFPGGKFFPWVKTFFLGKKNFFPADFFLSFGKQNRHVPRLVSYKYAPDPPKKVTYKKKFFPLTY